MVNRQDHSLIAPGKVDTDLQRLPGLRVEDSRCERLRELVNFCKTEVFVVANGNLGLLVEEPGKPELRHGNIFIDVGIHFVRKRVEIVEFVVQAGPAHAKGQL